MYVIGTAGHVDHGKSTLVEAITGIDPDRLQEEKDRGMTIDLGFAWLTLPSGQEVSVVDVPGHERFVKNMLAGVGGIDLALLLVAADEGVMPQTREHLAILDLLGVQRGVIVLTKKDLVDDEWLDLVTAEVEEVLTDTTLAQAPLVSVSGLTKEGLPLLLQTLDDLLAETPPKRDTGRPRLPIDRVFTIAGFGTIATGTLIDGSFTLGQEIEVQPQGLRSRIRGLQTHRQKGRGGPAGHQSGRQPRGIGHRPAYPRRCGHVVGLAAPHHDRGCAAPFAGGRAEPLAPQRYQDPAHSCQRNTDHGTAAGRRRAPARPDGLGPASPPTSAGDL